MVKNLLQKMLIICDKNGGYLEKIAKYVKQILTSMNSYLNLFAVIN